MKAYLDNAATTRPAIEVIKAIQDNLLNNYGNPSSIHYSGMEAEAAISKVREKIANIINAKPNEIIFTSGGTESNNLCIKGIVRASRKKHIVASSIEHASVLNTCDSLEDEGCKVTYVKVNSEGFVNPKEVEKAITKNTALVTIMHANNEVGSIQPIAGIGKVCRKHSVPLHTDAVQSFLKVPIDVGRMNVSAMSLSAHKIHGPKGVGVAYIRKDTMIEPLLHGGRHEFGLRAGTQNVPGIIGLGQAVESWKIFGVQRLRDYMLGRIIKEIPNVRVNSPKMNVLPSIINVSFPGLEGESILLHLSSLGVAASAGSACHERKIKVSHVLNAMGIQDGMANGAVRISLSRYNTMMEIDYAIKSLKTVIESLRRI